MKRLLIVVLALAFLSFSCNTIKTNNIHTRHGKENDQFKTPADKKYTAPKQNNKTKNK
jgi:hypothetical protein